VQSYEEFVETAELITAASGGRLELKAFPGGSIVPATDEFEGIDSGALDFGGTAGMFLTERYPAGALFTYQCGGLSPVEMLVWISDGGGMELYQKMIEGTNVYGLPASGQLMTPEVFLHSTKPINTVADLDGLKTRGAGDGAEVLKKLGAAMVFFPGSEIYESLQRGVIDAADIANPTIGWGLSVQEVAPYVYVSGARQPVQYSPTSVNKNSWAKLPDDLKLMVEQLNKAQPMREYGRYLVTDAASTQKFVEYGCEVVTLPSDVEIAFEEAAIEFYSEKAAADPFYAEVYNSILAFKSEMRQAFPRL
jgi:TRAP-type mannitol/chloroaromatic compound transport system substrate-binding protein